MVLTVADTNALGGILADEPGGWELKRALSELRDDVREGQKAIRDDVSKMVTQAAHDADMRRLEDQVKGVSDDLSSERQARVESVALERETRTIEHARETEARKTDVKHLQAQMDRTAVWVRWVAASVMVPTILFLANLLTDQGGA